MLNRAMHFFLYHPFFSLLIVTVIGIGGLLVAPFNLTGDWLPSAPIKVDAIPNIGDNQQIVFTHWAGHSPQEVEDQITYSLTSALMGMPGLKSIRSNSMFGFSSIYLIFDDDVDFYWSRSRILEKINSISAGLLPAGVQPVLGPDATALGQVYWYTIEGRDSLGQPTGGWDLHELRTAQDFYVKQALLSAKGVAEVGSIGGFVKEYQLDLKVAAMKAAGVSLEKVVEAVRNSNRDIGAKTLEVNRVEYFVRGLGYVKNIADLESIVVQEVNNIPLRIKDIARVSLGPAARRGILDKAGAEVVGGVVVAQFGANPLEVIQALKDRIEVFRPGMPSKILPEGRRSTLTIVPFYDRSELIESNLATLQRTLWLEMLITLLVVVFFLRSFRASLLVTLMLPLAILFTFLAMKVFTIEANIVALVGIAIAIGTMVDMGIVLVENIIQTLHENATIDRRSQVLTAVQEVLPAVATSVATTILGFLPLFFLQGAEGKLFTPLAFTKTFALASAFLVVWILLPVMLYWIGWPKKRLVQARNPRFPRKFLEPGLMLLVVLFLAAYWHPLGVEKAFAWNALFVAMVCGSLLLGFQLFIKKYNFLLRWCLGHQKAFLAFPIILGVLGILIWQGMGNTFMPTLNEGAFLLMPTSLAHAGMEENQELLQLLDLAVAGIPEVETVVGKAGRVESPLDPAPMSMFENYISWKDEFRMDEQGHYIRQWRDHIHSPEDIWQEIAAAVSQIPGLTMPPKLQPIQTRLLMLQTGMRSPLGIKIKGQDLQAIEALSLAIETQLRQVKGINTTTVFAERMIGKPYLEIDLDRQKIARYGLQVDQVQKYLEVALGGMPLSRTVEGRESYAIRLRYPKSLREDPEDIKSLLISTPQGEQLPLKALADIYFRKGPQNIRSEDGFMVGYVLFDKVAQLDESRVVQMADQQLKTALKDGVLTLPAGTTYEFAGTYKDQQRAFRQLQLIIFLALVLIFSVLYFQFRSIAISLMIFAGVLVALSGGFIGLWCYDQSWVLQLPVLGESLQSIFAPPPTQMSVPIWVGFLALFGIATDDGVLMATYLRQSLSTAHLHDRATLHKAILAAGQKRVRPAMMTTATTILALLPMLTSQGRGSELMVPMAIPLLGGMIFQIITVFTVPVLYALWQERHLTIIDDPHE